jgi:hypothetical protein
MWRRDDAWIARSDRRAGLTRATTADEIEPGERVGVSPQATVDFGVAAQRGDSVMGLSHGNADRSIR